MRTLRFPYAPRLLALALVPGCGGGSAAPEDAAQANATPADAGTAGAASDAPAHDGSLGPPPAAGATDADVRTADAGTDAALPPARDAGALRWESVEDLTAELAVPGVIAERVSYRSGSLRIYAQVCRPAAEGRYPVWVINHGGFSGLGSDRLGDGCRGATNVVSVESSYRGEDGSEGQVEVCAGEVDDVLALIDVTFAQPYADPARTAMFGVSHGGCITLRAVARGAPVAAAVDIEGPTDWASNYAFWQRGLADPAASTFTKSSYQQLIAALDAAVGGPPERFPAAYALRSPQSEAAQIAAFGGALLILHGAADVLVPPSQSCDLALQTGHYLASHTGAPSPFGLPNALVPTAPGECPEPALAWATASKPQALSPPWPGTRFLTIYDGIGHGAGGDMVPDVLSFFAAKGVAP